MANKSTTEYTDRFLKSSDHFHHLLTEEKTLLWILLVVVFTCSSCPALCNPMDCCPPLSMGFPDKNTGMGCHLLLQGIFLTQGSNLHLLHWQAGSLPLSHKENPNMPVVPIEYKEHFLAHILHHTLCLDTALNA